jgi:dsDNA-specific endonuclease/ATPase MutS2
MKQELIRIRAELLSNYEKRIDDLHQLLSRAKELAPEAKVEIQKRIKLLQKRKRRLEDRYKEIDDLREEAAQLRESVREIRALLSTSNRKSLIKRKGNHSH